MNREIALAGEQEAALIRLVRDYFVACLDKGHMGDTCNLSDESYGRWNDLRDVIEKKVVIDVVEGAGYGFGCAYKNLAQGTSEREYFDCLEEARDYRGEE